MTIAPPFPNLFVKPAVQGRGGAAVAQHPDAAAAGAAVLSEGGNAVDAAVTMALSMAALEPWMSGLGGGGFLLTRMGGEVHQLDFNMVSPLAATPDKYPLAGGVSPGMFAWPTVEGDRNTKGPMSICTPGVVAGAAAALERFGTISWERAMQPAVDLAGRGLTVDWFTTLCIATTAAELAEHPSTAAAFMPDGFPLAQPTGHPAPVLKIPGLVETLTHLAAAGWEDFYRGDLAAKLSADFRDVGALLTAQDLASYQADWTKPATQTVAGWECVTTSGLSGGVTTAAILEALATVDPQDNDAFVQAFITSADQAFSRRLQTMGHAGDLGRDACTTHLSVVDRHGNLVSLTQTLLGRFGSRVVLPETGVLMNNGMMWFDPTPGRPNSVAPGKSPLANMSPMLAMTPDGSSGFALGASGGRHIIGSVAQAARRLIAGAGAEEALSAPRAAVVTPGRAALDCRFPDTVAEAARQVIATVEQIPPMVYPTNYACVGVAGFDDSGSYAAAEPSLPWPTAMAATE